MLKKHVLIIFSILLAGSCPSNAFAQTEIASMKPDLSNPDRISMPPMDPYSLSYIPEMPAGAKNIITPNDCRSQGGVWANMPSERMINDFAFQLVGCKINDKPEGRWMYAGVETGKIAETIYQELSEKNAYGYVWMNDGLKEGWDVVLNAPEEFVRILQAFHQGKKEGTTFNWDENGVLIQVETYKNDVYDGKYEAYDECLPMARGQYENGVPVGDWHFYSQPGKAYYNRFYDRKASKNELPPGLPEDAQAYWTEWFNNGVKTVQGYTISKSPDDEGIRVGPQQLFSSAGAPWIVVNYNEKGQIADDKIFDLCKDKPTDPIPPELSFQPEDRSMMCIDANNNIYRQIFFYGTGQVWKKVAIKDDVPNGLTIEYHPTGEILAKYQVINDVPDGEIVYLNTDGKPMALPSVIDHGNGSFRAWWYNGKPREEGEYISGLKNGLWRTWYDTGSLESEREMKNGSKNGTSKEWFTNGVLSSEVEYLMGARHGIVTGFYVDGHVSYKYNFQNDRAKGICYDYTHAGQVSSLTDFQTGTEPPFKQTRYYSDGKKQSEGHIVPGFVGPVRTGRWDFYLKNGNRWYSANYEFDEIRSNQTDQCTDIDGEYKIDEENHEIGCSVCAVNRDLPFNPTRVREGEWQWFNEAGFLEKKGSIHIARMNGEWEYYYPNGKIMLRGTYQLDRRIGRWIGYFDDGQKKFDGEYDGNGLETGHWTTYHPVTEKVSSEGMFKNGKRDGEWIWRFSDGKVREQGKFIDGAETGTWTTLHENGQKAGEGEFIDGKRTGRWTWWREDGAVWRTADYVDGKEILK